MRILAIDTSTSACSVALSISKQNCLYEYDLVSNQHTQRVMQQIRRLLERTQIAWSELQAIAVNEGPGSFTGVRIGFSLAQGLAMALQKPLILCSGLAILAEAIFENHPEQASQPILVGLDARLGDYYWAYYQRQGDETCLVGQAQLGKLPDQEEPPRFIEALPHAQYLLSLAIRAFERGEGIPPELASPTYIRNQVV